MSRIHKVMLIFSIFVSVLVAESIVLCTCSDGPTVFCGRTIAFMGVVALLVTVLMGAWISSIVEISARKRMKERLRESEERFHLLEENIQGVFWLMEGDALKLLYVSPAYENIWGRPCGHLYDEPRSWPHAVFPEDREYVRASFNDVRSGGSEVVYRIVHPDNSVRWIWDRAFPILNASGQVHRIAGIAEDITRMKQLEDDLADALREHLNIMDTIQDIIYVLDLKGKVLKWNRQAETATGFSGNEILRKSALSLFPKYERQVVAGAIREVVEKGHAQLEAHLLRKNGITVPYLWSGTALKDERGDVIGIAGVGRDITDRARLEEELRRARDGADKASRAKSEFLAVMSHELRTPLNAVIGFSQVLADRTFGELNAKQAKYVDNILTNGRRLLQLVSEILDMVNIESGSMELSPSPVDVAKAIDDIVNRPDSWIKTSARQKNIALRAECEQDIPTILADRPKFMQILHNLLTNAVKFTPEGGSICMTAKQVADFPSRIADLERQEERADIGGVSSDIQHSKSEIEQGRSGIEISIFDTGIGIKPEDRERIFREFEQADSSYSRNHQGAGLGLTLTRRLIELHGGRIQAESEGKGKGSTFTFVLPVTRHGPFFRRNEQ